MRRLARAVALMIAVLAVLVVVVAHSPLILDWVVSKATATARTKGLEIHWGGRVTANEVDLLDPKGIYARFQDVNVVWSPFRLIDNDIDVALLRVGHGEFLRLPQSSSSGGAAGTTKTEVHNLRVERLTIAQAVAGTEATLKLDGSLTWVSLDNADIDLKAARIGGGGMYDLSANLTHASIHAQLAVKEMPGGLIANAASLPDIGPIDLAASVAGPRSDLATQLALTAGKLRANLQGHVNLEGKTLTAKVDATAPAMTPRPGLSFQSAALNATISGGFTNPDLTSSLRIDALAASGATVQRIDVNATGNRGRVQVRAELDGVTVPGRQPGVFAAAPILLTADARLDAPDRPVAFTLRHPLIDASGTARTAGVEQAELQLNVPQLGPLAAAEGLDLQGSTSLHLTASRQSGATQLALDGTVSLTSGSSPGPALIGTSARLALVASLAGDSLDLSRLRVDGQDVSVAANGAVSPQKVDLAWSVALPRLAAVDPKLAGALQAHGQFTGSEQNLALAADLAGEVGMPGQSSGPFTAHLQAVGLPHAPQATVSAQGALLGSPLQLALTGTRQPDGAMQLTIHQATWKSAAIEGALTLPAGATVPVGDLTLAVQTLSDFAPLVGQPVTGSAHLTLHATPEQAVVIAELHDTGVSGTGSVANATVNATIANPASHPSVDAHMVVAGLSAGSLTGSMNLDAKGPANQLQMQLAASLPKLDGSEARLATTATVDVPAKTVTLSALSGDWRQQNLHLLAPARFAFADGVNINDLRLALGDAVIQVNGRVGATLDLTASAHDVPVSLAALVSPSLAATGTVSADAQLTGTSSAPTGTIRATGAGLRLENATGRNLPPASFTANATLQGTAARVDATVTAGPSHLTLTGQAPFTTAAPLDLRTDGTINLALADPFLRSQGGGVAGTVTLAATITGTATHPAGTIHATGAGVRLENATGRNLPPANFTANATLQGTTARVDATVTAGPSHLTLTGEAPFTTTAPLDLRTQGTINLAMADPFLRSQGGGAAGTVTLAATITGTATKPGGTVRVQASGVRLLTQTGRALPPAAATATATLNGTSARIDARVTAGASNLAVSGTAPLRLSGPLDLRTTGTINLAVANPLLEANGERVAGIINIALNIAGTATAPRLTGDAQLSGGDLRDYAQGAHLSAISARLTAAGDVLRLDSLSARAGEGTITGSGTIGVAPPMPINLKLAAHNATPLTGGIVTATLDAALGIEGDVGSRIALDGTVDVHQAVIQVPSKLPTSVATIPIRILGARPPPPPPPPLVIAMGLTVRAPQQIWVRGRGLNVELGGAISIQGTTTHMQPRGSFALRRGTFNLVGTTLTFTSGDIDFNGGSLTDPELHLVATSASGTSSSTLTVGGTASNPKITLSSVPEMPQDQILAQLLFPNNNGQLSPFQLAAIAQGLAELSGSTSNFPNPLQGVQNALGLDALGIGTGPNGSPSLQAGRYIGRRLYVGAQQSASGAGGQGTIQYDITKGLKLNATVGTGETTSAIGASGESNGASVGVTYQFQY